MIPFLIALFVSPFVVLAIYGGWQVLPKGRRV